ncbi:hypothetical protein CR513_09166, partial [Mucuna pruriens]
MKIGMTLRKEEEDQLMLFLTKNRDVFSWCLVDMPGVPNDATQARRLIRKASKYTFVDEDKFGYVMQEVREGVCGTHIGRRALANYFTKSVEAEPITTISAKRVKCFYWKKLIWQFGLPTEIVSNNETQFASRSVADFYAQLKIR